ncbi:MAG TPA: ACT domain-containing protein [Candidatus Acidoferrales bacterium]|nr:ACT domain-containing protein [Candidatus Acidoferrales bacterium]
MPKAKQFSVRVENRPGTLAHVARVLGDGKVNILAFLTTTSGGEGTVHVVADNVNKAKTALEGAALDYTESDVLYVELPNTPGALGHFAGKLAAKNINITSGYQTAVKGSRKAGVVLAVSDLDGAVRIR